MPAVSRTVSVFLETQKVPVSTRRIKQITFKLLSRLSVAYTFLNIYLVDDRKMRRLNKQFLSHDWTTDVLAFSHTEGPGPMRGKGLSGDIVVSLETTQRQAKDFGNPFFYELCFYICHGILHLLGYRDKKKSDAEKMFKRQEQLLRQIKLAKKPAREKVN